MHLCVVMATSGHGWEQCCCDIMLAGKEGITSRACEEIRDDAVGCCTLSEDHPDVGEGQAWGCVAFDFVDSGAVILFMACRHSRP